jgi:hypothetical protein
VNVKLTISKSKKQQLLQQYSPQKATMTSLYSAITLATILLSLFVSNDGALFRKKYLIDARSELIKTYSQRALSEHDLQVVVCLLQPHCMAFLWIACSHDAIIHRQCTFSMYDSAFRETLSYDEASSMSMSISMSMSMSTPAKYSVTAATVPVTPPLYPSSLITLTSNAAVIGAPTAPSNPAKQAQAQIKKKEVSAVAADINNIKSPGDIINANENGCQTLSTPTKWMPAHLVD